MENFKLHKGGKGPQGNPYFMNKMGIQSNTKFSQSQPLTLKVEPKFDQINEATNLPFYLLYMGYKTIKFMCKM